MKKHLKLFAIAAIAISLVACKQPNNEKPAEATDNTTQNPGTSDPDPAPTPEPTPAPTPDSEPSDEPVLKDYFIEPITSTDDLEDSEWYFQKTIDSKEQLLALGLDDDITSLTAVYRYFFYPYLENDTQTGPKTGYFDTDYKITVNDSVSESEYDTICDELDNYFPHFYFKWSTDGNNISITFGEDDNEKELSAVFENGSVKITYPKTMAPEIKLGDGSQDVVLPLSQTFTVFYDGVHIEDNFTPLEMQRSFGLTLDTDYKINGPNADITNQGVEKFIANMLLHEMDYQIGDSKWYLLVDEYDNGKLTYEEELFPDINIEIMELEEGTDYSISHNGYVIQFTEDGEDKIENFDDCLRNHEKGFYYREILLPVPDTLTPENFTDYLKKATKYIDYYSNENYQSELTVFFSDSGLEMLLNYMKKTDEERPYLIYIEENMPNGTISGIPQDLTEGKNEDYFKWDNGLVIELTDAGWAKIRPGVYYNDYLIFTDTSAREFDTFCSNFGTDITLEMNTDYCFAGEKVLILEAGLYDWLAIMKNFLGDSVDPEEYLYLVVFPEQEIADYWNLDDIPSSLEKGKDKDYFFWDNKSVIELTDAGWKKYERLMSQ